MSELRAIRIERGPQGFGGPLIIRPTEQKNKVMYITGGGTAPECLKKIVELSGMTPVDGFHGSAPEEELAMVIVDCGGTLRCGIYPQKRIPTVNVMPVGKSGPLANFITEDIYVSAVTSKQISLAEEGEAVQAAEVSEKKEEKAVKFNADQKVSETLAAQENKSIITKVRFTWTRCRYRTDCRNINRNRNWKGNNRSTACTSSPFRNQLSGRM